MSDYGPAWYVGERPCGLAGEIGGEERKKKRPPLRIVILGGAVMAYQCRGGSLLPMRRLAETCVSNLNEEAVPLST